LRRKLAPLLLVAALGCAGPPPVDPETDSPLAYAVRAPDGGRAVLFGSIHVARENQWELPDLLTRELARSELLVLEIDLAATSSGEVAQIMLGLGVMPPGQRLRQVVSDETWELLLEQAPETGQPIEQIDRLKPWVVALQFIGYSLQKAGFDPQHGVERDVVAGAPSLPVRGLETAYEQLSTFDDLPFPVQDRMLLDALRPSEEQAPELDALMQAWRSGDAERLEAIVFEDRSDPELSIFYQETYDRRNLRMVEALEEILRDTERAFVIVGAAHLVGTRGIPSLLREFGYDVRQISGRR